MKKFVIILIALLLICTCVVYTFEKQELAQAEESIPSYYCLRDTMYLPASNQFKYDNCWVFSNTKAVETTLTKKTGYYYDFSEAYITLCNEYLKIDQTGDNKPTTTTSELGSNGADQFTFENLIKKYGIVHEIDFPFNELAYVNASNILDNYTYYSQFADKKIAKDLEIVSLTNTAAIKSHIMNYGAAVLNDNSAAHSMAIIGWDDNKDGGSFIILDSYGNNSSGHVDGIIYKSYNLSLNTKAFGYKLKELADMPDNDIILITEQSYDHDVVLRNVGKYNSLNLGVVNEYTTRYNNLFKASTVALGIICDFNIPISAQDVTILNPDGKPESTNICQFVKNNGTSNWDLIFNEGNPKWGCYTMVVNTGGKIYRRHLYFLGDLTYENILNQPATGKAAYYNAKALGRTINIFTEKSASNIYKVYVTKSIYSNFEIFTPDETDENYDKYSVIDDTYQIEIQLKTDQEGLNMFEIPITLNGKMDFRFIINLYIGGYIASIKTIQKNNAKREFAYLTDINSHYINITAQDYETIKNGSVGQLDSNFISLSDCAQGDLSKNKLTKNNVYKCDTYKYGLVVRQKQPLPNVMLNHDLESIQPVDQLNVGLDMDFMIKKVNVEDNGTVISTGGDFTLDTGTHELAITIQYLEDNIILREITQNVTVLVKQLITMIVENNSVEYNAQEHQLPNVYLVLHNTNQRLPDSLYDLEYAAYIKDAGEYEINATFNDPQYQLHQKGIFTVRKKPVTITVINKTSIQNEPLEELECTTEGFIEENIEVTVTTNANIRVPGTYEITANCYNGNYEYTIHNGTYTIEPYVEDDPIPPAPPQDDIQPSPGDGPGTNIDDVRPQPNTPEDTNPDDESRPGANGNSSIEDIEEDPQEENEEFILDKKIVIIFIGIIAAVIGAFTVLTVVIIKKRKI